MILYLIDDDNRIILKPMVGRPDCQGDYINASFVNVSMQYQTDKIYT